MSFLSKCLRGILTLDEQKSFREKTECFPSVGGPMEQLPAELAQKKKVYNHLHNINVFV